MTIPHEHRREQVARLLELNNELMAALEMTKVPLEHKGMAATLKAVDEAIEEFQARRADILSTISLDRGGEEDGGSSRITGQDLCADAQERSLQAPEGWALVPVEATDDMMDAAIGLAREQPPHMSGKFGWVQARAAYKGFIGAAPTPPTTPDTGPKEEGEGR